MFLSPKTWPVGADKSALRADALEYEGYRLTGALRQHLRGGKIDTQTLRKRITVRVIDEAEPDEVNQQVRDVEVASELAGLDPAFDDLGEAHEKRILIERMLDAGDMPSMSEVLPLQHL